METSILQIQGNEIKKGNLNLGEELYLFKFE